MKLDSIVVGYDGSGPARAAVKAAGDLAGVGTMIHVVTAYDAPKMADLARLVEELPEEFKTTFDHLAGPRSHLEEAEAMLAAAGLDHKGHFVEGEPANAILDVADDTNADMIVVGSRGLGRGTRFLRGSVSTRVANHAPRSFMIVHGDLGD